jgi:phosphomannomutase
MLDQARSWLADDPDPTTAGELAALIAAVEAEDATALADLADRFSGFLEFGTAGLRGAIGAGPMRMNRAVVIRAAAGLSAYLAEALTAAGHAARARVVVGFDARHRSADFAQDTAAVMHAAGHEALILPGPLPTPVLAYAVRALGADAGVMVTASHNPPQDNGYKVYLGGRVVTDAGRGAQIVPPYDALIAAQIAAVSSVASVPRADSGWTTLAADIVDDYIAAAAAVVASPVGEIATRRAATRIVLTSLHGVGGETLVAALNAAGFTDLHPVAEQAEPDPDFPTVAFPNPEEPGAIDLALALAARVSPDVVIANDPDADRCAMAARVDGEWTMLHGDVVGSLLGERIASQYRGEHPDGPARVLASSIVSSRQLGAIAARHGLVHRATLTGFKWIAREEGILFGYEEALGLCVAPELVADKDGITAAVLIAELTSELKAAGRQPADAIDDLARAYGVYLTRQVSARFADASLIPGTMSALLASPPASLGGAEVTSADDMNVGIDGLPPTNGLRLETVSGSRVIIRPSGTEPKVKAYLEVIEPLSDGDLSSARARAADTMATLEADVRAALGLD